MVLRKNILRLTPLTVLASLLVSGVAVPPASPPEVIGRTVDLAADSATVAPDWQRKVELPIEVNALSFSWTDFEQGELEVRVRKGETWGDWFEMHGNPDEGPDPGSSEFHGGTSVGPVWVGDRASAAEVRVVHGELRGLRLHAIYSEVDPRAWTPPAAMATPSRPGIVSRAGWGADESLRKCGPDYASNVRYSIVHHTVTGGAYTQSEAAAIIRSIYYHHTQVNGWCDIGYNFLVDWSGVVYEGRYGGVDRPVIGAHAGGFNTGSTGIAIIGDQSSIPPPSATIGAINSTLAWKLTHHGVDAGASIQVTSGGSTKYPAGTVVTLSTINGHRDVSLTACPGDRTYPLLGTFRREVQRISMSTPPYPLPGWSAEPSQPSYLVLDNFGGLHPVGSQTAVNHSAFWPGSDIARGALPYDSTSGYVVDGFGGMHRYGDPPALSRPGPYWQGWDIVRGVAPGAVSGTGYVLDGYGGIHPFGGATQTVGAPYFGSDIARDIATTSTGGYILDGFGGVHPFGSSAPIAGTPYWKGWDIARAVAVTSDGLGGYVLDAWGGLHAFGTAPQASTNYYTPWSDTARDVILLPGDGGGWVLDSYGRLWPFGGAMQLKHSLTWVGLDAAQAVIGG